MTIFGYTLRALRIAKGLSVEALSDKVSLRATTLENLENGYIEPDEKTAELLALFFGVTVGYMKGSVEVRLVSDEKQTDASLAESPGRFVKLHPISPTSSNEQNSINEPSEAEEIILPLPSSDRSDYAAIYVTDHSMRSFRAEKGDILVVRQDPFRIRSGDLVLIAAEDGQHLLRRYFRDGGTVTLYAGDGETEPIRIRLSDTRYQFLGTVVQIVIRVTDSPLPPVSPTQMKKERAESPYTYRYADDGV